MPKPESNGGVPAPGPAAGPGLYVGANSDFPRNYLSTYYCQPPTADERIVLSFLVQHGRCLNSRPRAIEIGCGPTVHHALPLAQHVSEFHMADYLPGNLEQIALWRDESEQAHDWRHYAQLTLELEGAPATEWSIARRERETRAKLARLRHCDLTQDAPLGALERFEVVSSFYCAENVGITRDEWAAVMGRIAGLVEPGGYLFMSALRETDFYVIRAADGALHRFPSAYLTARDFEELLPTLGFDMADTVIESATTTGLEAEGLKGVILVAGRKA